MGRLISRRRGSWRATMGPQCGNGPPPGFAPSTSRAVEPVIVAVTLKIQPFSVRACIHLFSIGMRRIAATPGMRYHRGAAPTDPTVLVAAARVMLCRIGLRLAATLALADTSYDR